MRQTKMTELKMKYQMEIKTSPILNDKVEVCMDLTDNFRSDIVFNGFSRFLQRVGIPEKVIINNLLDWTDSLLGVEEDKQVPRKTKTFDVDQLNTKENREKFLKDLTDSPNLLETVFIMFNEHMLMED